MVLCLMLFVLIYFSLSVHLPVCRSALMNFSASVVHIYSKLWVSGPVCRQITHLACLSFTATLEFSGPYRSCRIIEDRHYVWMDTETFVPSSKPGRSLKKDSRDQYENRTPWFKSDMTEDRETPLCGCCQPERIQRLLRDVWCPLPPASASVSAPVQLVAVL